MWGLAVGLIVAAIVGIFAALVWGPITRHRTSKYDVHEILLRHMPAYSSAGPDDKALVADATKGLQDAAARLQRAYGEIPVVRFLAALRLVLDSTNLYEAHRQLLQLSQSVGTGDRMSNIELAENILVLLKLAKNRPLTERWQRALSEVKNLLG